MVGFIISTKITIQRSKVTQTTYTKEGKKRKTLANLKLLQQRNLKHKNFLTFRIHFTVSWHSNKETVNCYCVNYYLHRVLFLLNVVTVRFVSILHKVQLNELMLSLLEIRPKTRHKLVEAW